MQEVSGSIPLGSTKSPPGFSGKYRRFAEGSSLRRLCRRSAARYEADLAIDALNVRFHVGQTSDRRVRSSFASLSRSLSGAVFVHQVSRTSSPCQRGFTCKCKWNTSCPAARPSERRRFTPSQPVTAFNSLATLLAARKISAPVSSSKPSRLAMCFKGTISGWPSSDRNPMTRWPRKRTCPGAWPAIIEQKIHVILHFGSFDCSSRGNRSRQAHEADLCASCCINHSGLESGSRGTSHEEQRRGPDAQFLVSEAGTLHLDLVDPP